MGSRKEPNINLQNLAETPQLQTYASKPVENYGMALLRGMGFNQSRGIGKSKTNQLTDIFVLKPRPKGLGLGAETMEEPAVQQLEVGDKILVTEDPHKGLVGYVNEKLPEDCYKVELYPSKSIVKVNIKAMKKISKSEMKKLQEEMGGGLQQSKKRKRIKWAVPQIRVKIVNPKSQHYLKKMTITEIDLNERVFECRDDQGKTIPNLTEQDVQTVVPKTGGEVLIVRGKNAGQRAVVMDRKKSKSQVTVQTTQELEIINVDEDDISEYVQL